MKNFNSSENVQSIATFVGVLITLFCGYSLYLVFVFLSTGQIKMTAIYLLVLLLLVWNFAGALILIFSALFYVKQFKKGDYSDAEKTIVNTLNLLKILPLRKLPLYLVYSNLGHMRLMQGKFADAEAPLRTAVAGVQANKRFSKHYTAAVPINNLARVCMRVHKLEESENLAKQALAIYMNNQKQPTWAHGLPLVILGRICFVEGRNQESKEYFEKAEKAFECTNVPGYVLADNAEHSKIACATYLAILLFKEEKLSEARDKCSALLNKLSKDSRYLTPDALAVMNDLIQTLNQNGDNTLANWFLQYASAVAKRYPDHPDSKQILNH
jgi:tetratricopeptide (TPR) repeat protein